MPELSVLPNSGLPHTLFQPLNPASYRDREPPIDTRAASALQGKAALYSSLAKVLSELPDQLMASYQKGKKLSTGRAVTNQFNQALQSGDSRALAQFKATGEGELAFAPQDPALEQAKIDYYNRATKSSGLQHIKPQPIYDELGNEWQRETGVAPASSGTEPVGKITDYGQADDPLRDTNSVEKHIGAWDNPLEDGVSLAVSPDVRAQFEASGIKPKDPVVLKLSDGQTVTARWDDVTANDEQARQLNLPPLRGRFDIFSPSGAHPLRDAQVIGFEKPAPIPQQTSSVSPERQMQIQSAATDIGNKLPNIPMSELTASNEAGPIPPANVQPSLAQIPVMRPRMGLAPGGGRVVPTGPETTMTVYPGDRIVTNPKTATEDKEKESPTENALNRAIIARGKNPIGMSLEEKEQFLKTEVPLRPSEKLSAIRDLRQAYHELPSTTVLFGKGQMPGLDQVIEKLEEIKKSAGDDFSKMSPQQGRTVVFQFSKFNDPNSAVLLGEYKAAADTLSIPDKLFQIINKAATGETVTPTQAKDIYDTVKAAYNRAKENYVTDAGDIMEEAKAMHISPTRLSIPSRAQGWMEGKEKTNEAVTTPATPKASTPETTTAAAPVIQAQGSAILEKYKSGGYDSNPGDKAKAEVLLRKAGLL